MVQGKPDGSTDAEARARPPSAAATLAGSIRDTISVRSMKEALGQVSTLGAEAKETSGEAPDHSRPHPLYDPLWS